MSRSFSSFRRLAIALTLTATGLTTTAIAFADEGTASSDSASETPKPVHHHHHTDAPKAAETPAASATTAAAESPAPAASAAAAAPATSAQTAAPSTPESKPLVLREAAAANAQPSKPMSLMADPAQGASWKIVGILGAMCGAAWVFKKKQEKKAPAESIKSLQVLKKLSVGVRSELLVVDIDGQRLLIGVTPSTITTLASIPEVELENAMMHAEAVERALPQTRKTQSEGHDLGDRFAALVEGSRTTSGSVMARNPTLPRESKPLQMPSQQIRRRSSATITQSRQSSSDEELEGQARGLAQRFGKTGSRA